MRIGLLTHQWPGVRLGGIGAYTLHAARALALAGHEPHVFTFTLPDDARHIIPQGIMVHEVADLATRAQNGTLPANLAAAVQAGGEPTYRLALGALLCDEVRSVHARTPLDILEAPEYEAMALPLITSPLPDLPVVTHIHSGSAVIRLAMNLPLTADQLLFESLEFAAILAADGVCAPSRQVIADTHKSCLLDKVEPIPLPFIDDARAPFTAPKPDAPILFIGRLELIKGAHLLPDALNIFLTKNPRATIHLAGPDTPTAPDGSGSMQNYIRAHVTPPLLARIQFLGEQPRAQLAAELANASFVIVPSLFESYSYVCCEALSAGRPVIVSDSIGATDVVADAGLTFHRGDALSLATAMHELHNDPALLQQLANRAYRRAHEALSPEATIGKRITFYERIITRQKSAPRPSLHEMLSNIPQHYIPALIQTLTRVTTTLAGVPDPQLDSPGMRLTKIMDQLGSDTKIILYGAGRHTSRLLAEKHLWESKGHRVIGLIDDHPRFAAQPTHLNLPVDSLQSFATRANPTDLAVVLSTDTFTDQFWQNTAPLRTKGFKVFRLYD